MPKCPFEPKRGYVDARIDYLNHFHSLGSSNSDDDDSSHPSSSRVAGTNPDDPLFFWQLYSLIGHHLVVDIVSEFYERVFADTDNPWFRDVFERAAPKGHHINTQVAYWVDAFGGGRCYHGGNYRLNFHHTHNAREIMTAKGAAHWMHHMKETLLHLLLEEKHPILVDDPRIFCCIVNFLETKMRTYAEEHGWKFDESDFATLKEAATPAINDKKEVTIIPTGIHTEKKSVP